MATHTNLVGGHARQAGLQQSPAIVLPTAHS
ncbi:hypothetical protein VTH06DRAFT_1103 [Thermothelomyces fergusii]